jgi:prepilin-type processing-associated H-X9-DG protein
MTDNAALRRMATSYQKDISLSSATESLVFEMPGRSMVFWIDGHVSATDTLTLNISYDDGSNYTATDVTATLSPSEQWIYSDVTAKLKDLRGQKMKWVSAGSAISLSMKMFSVF